MLKVRNIGKLFVVFILTAFMSFSPAYAEEVEPGELPPVGGDGGGATLDGCDDGGVCLDFGGTAVEKELPGTTGTDPLDPVGSFGTWLGSLISITMTVAAILVLLYLLWGGLEWISAGGDSGKIQKARERITQAVIGIIVLSASTAIFIIVQRFLGICVIDFGGTCVEAV